MLSKDEVKHIAKLARLGLTEKETGKFQKELSSILGYIEKLKKVDISKTKPASHAIEVENVMRGDDKTTDPIPEKLLNLAPETKGGFLKVKSILK